MNKKLMIIGVSALCAVSMALGAAASSVIKKIEAELRPDFTISVDGKEQVFKDAQGNVVSPILYDGTTYLPVRAIGELMGKTVYWYEDDKLIDLKSEKSTVTDADVIVPSSTSKPAVTPKPDEISLNQAKEIALEKAGLKNSDVVFTKAYLDTDDGRREYDLEFHNKSNEYSAEILASDGTIHSWEVEKYDDKDDTSDKTDIGLDNAKKTALNKAGLHASEVIFEKAEIDYENGVSVYEIEFRKGNKEYSAEIKVSDGTIISWDVEYDD